MDKQRVNVVNGNPFAETRFEGKNLEVRFVKWGLETTKKVGECEFVFAEAEIGRGVDEDRFGTRTIEEVARPQIAMQQGWGFFRNEVAQPSAQGFYAFVELEADFFFHEAKANHGQNPVLNHETDAIGFPPVVEGNGHQAVGIRVAESLMSDLVHGCELPSGCFQCGFCRRAFGNGFGKQVGISLNFAPAIYFWRPEIGAEHFQIFGFGFEKVVFGLGIDFNKINAFRSYQSGAGIDHSGSYYLKIEQGNFSPKAFKKQRFKELGKGCLHIEFRPGQGKWFEETGGGWD